MYCQTKMDNLVGKQKYTQQMMTRITECNKNKQVVGPSEEITWIVLHGYFMSPATI